MAFKLTFVILSLPKYLCVLEEGYVLYKTKIPLLAHSIGMTKKVIRLK